MVKVAIIGTAGRGATKKWLSKEVFDFMVEQSMSIIKDKFNLDWSQVDLVSGGAAWADHVAVALFLTQELSSLTLYLPCNWHSDGKNSCYVDTGKKDYKTNPGRTANLYHKYFSEQLGINTLEQIDIASKAGAKLDSSHHGFLNRNTEVAKCDHMIAFTFGEGEEPTDGGTMNTWNKCTSKSKIHIPLGAMKQNTNAKQDKRQPKRKSDSTSSSMSKIPKKSSH